MKPVRLLSLACTVPLALAAAALVAAPPAISVKRETPLYEFEYSYPPAAAAIPGLRARLEADRAQRLAKLTADARNGQAEAKKGGFPFHRYSWSQTWQVVASPPGWLSLSAAYWNYTGGAHGMSWSGAMLWDRKANLPRNPLDLFTSKAALAQAIRAPFCAALNRARIAKRGGTIKPGSTEMFEECIDPLKQTVLLGSKSKLAFDRIGILIAPYEAGPFAEGGYEVTLPMTPAVLAAVRPGFRRSFAVGR